MTIERLYSCDICHDPLANDNKTSLATKEGFGIRWASFPTGKMVKTRMHEAEHHICTQCAESIKSIVEEQ